MLGQAPVGVGTIRFRQQRVHGSFDPSGGNSQSMIRDLLAGIAIAQRQRLMKHFQHLSRKSCGRRRYFLDEVPAAGPEMIQAALVVGILELYLSRAMLRVSVKAAPTYEQIRTVVRRSLRPIGRR